MTSLYENRQKLAASQAISGDGWFARNEQFSLISLIKFNWCLLTELIELISVVFGDACINLVQYCVILYA